MLPQKAGMLITVLILRKLNFYSGINGLLPRPVEFYFSRYTAFQNLYADYFFLWTIGFAAPFLKSGLHIRLLFYKKLNKLS